MHSDVRLDFVDFLEGQIFVNGLTFHRSCVRCNNQCHVSSSSFAGLLGSDCTSTVCIAFDAASKKLFCGTHCRRKQAKALYSCDPSTESNESLLPFKEGDVVEVLDNSHPDWWRALFKGRQVQA